MHSLNALASGSNTRLAVLQGAMTALAVVLSGFMTDAVLNNLSLVGNILIFCVAKNHQGGKPAAVPSGCSGADGDFMNRNLLNWKIRI